MQYDCKNKTILLSNIGAIFEYYDFIIYGMMSVYLMQIFFVNDLPQLALLKTLGVFVIAYFARPFGGYLFGVIADLYGRKVSLLWSMSLMIIATFGIGCLPTYHSIGWLAPCCLIIARILQGLSFGAEMPSIITITQELATQQTKLTSLRFIVSSTSCGALLASLMVFVLATFFTQQEITAWAWRIPFLFSGILAIIVFSLRRTMPESNEFLIQQQAGKLLGNQQQLLRMLLQKHRRNIVFAVVFALFFADLIIFSVYLPMFLNQYFKLSIQAVYCAQSIGIGLNIFLAPFLGPRKFFSSYLCMKFLVITYVLLLLSLIFASKYQLDSLIFILIIGYQTIIAAYAVKMLDMLTDLFPVTMRATGLGISYNIAYVIASLKQLFLQTCVNFTNNPFCIIFTAAIIAILVILATTKITKYRLQQQKEPL